MGGEKGPIRTDGIYILCIRPTLHLEVLVNFHSPIFLDFDSTAFQELRRGCNTNPHDYKVSWKEGPIDDNATSRFGVPVLRYYLVNHAPHVKRDTLGFMILTKYAKQSSTGKISEQGALTF